MQNQELLQQGLTSEQAKRLQEKFGKNELTHEKKQSFIVKIFHIIFEPMFLLLIIAAIIYFILGEPIDAAIMLVFVIGIISIEIIQELKTDKTLNALKELSAPHIKVIRNGKEVIIASKDLVPEDIMIITEGVKIPADGEIIKCNDLCIDESSLTGESEGVWKVETENYEQTNDYWRKDYCYSGTLVIQGSAYIRVSKIGLETEYGKISANVAEAPKNPTPLQKQIDIIVKICATFAGILFFFVALVTYFNIPDHEFKERIIESILSGIALAMATIPEEFPVILTVFLSMGAWRLAKKQSLIRNLPSVETLGAVSVLCVDKTGTITKNEMTVQEIWSINENEDNLIKIMGMACETEVYDPMEKAMLKYCEKTELFNGDLIKEYPFTNELKMMGHVWEKQEEIIIASKGAPEGILSICNLEEQEKVLIENKRDEMSNQGIRVIAVGMTKVNNKSEIPEKLTDCKLTFCGLVGLIDPPREKIKEDIRTCNEAGVRVVMITGDNGITARAIAKKIGIKDCNNIITGEELNNMNDEELKECIKNVNVFSRVIPEHKMRIVKAFKENGEIVAMTGDGVNDAPALKYADIGIAMGKRGSEVSREAADLILLDDNFSIIVDTIKDGRRIYDNIRKAIGYVLAVHIPIAFASLLAPLLNISPNSLLFLPLHVVLLELFIDPTCSIVLERQPSESDIMSRTPRDPKENILNKETFIKSIIQGLVIFSISFSIYFLILNQNPDKDTLARTMGISIIVLSNLFLVHVNSSEIDSIIYSTKQLIKDKVMLVTSFMTILIMVLLIYTPINNFIKFTELSLNQLAIVIISSVIGVFWYEFVKLFKRIRISKIKVNMNMHEGKEG